MSPSTLVQGAPVVFSQKPVCEAEREYGRGKSEEQIHGKGQIGGKGKAYASCTCTHL